MNQSRAVVALVVLLAGGLIADAQSVSEPAVSLGLPIPTPPELLNKLGVPRAAPAPPAVQRSEPLNKLGVPNVAPAQPSMQKAEPPNKLGMPSVAVPSVTSTAQPPPPVPSVPSAADPALLLAQLGMAPPPWSPPSPLPVPDVPASPATALPPANPAWVQVDYLMWWARGGPTGGPLLTTGGTGVLGAPGTQVLLGDRPMGYGPFSGVRITGGVPVADGLSMEAGYFYLGQRTFGFSAGSDRNGVPLVARPAINAQTGAQAASAVTLPGARAGDVAVESQIRMDGYEFNLSHILAQTGSVRFDVLGGFRALDMSEALAIRDQRTVLTAGALSFNGMPLPAGSDETDFDRFATTNHFYGGQLGGRLGWFTGPFSVSAVAKVALGVTQQSVDITGGSERFMLGANPLSVPGGFLALPSNIGHYYRSTFSVVPQAGLQVGYQVTPWLRATVGYTLIYWTHVARPGNQTDRAINPALVPTSPAFGIGGGPALPALPSIRESDFWVQGMNFGLALIF